MMILVTACLFGISIGCFTWYFVYRRQNQQLVASRLYTDASGGTLSFPYPVADLASEKKSEEVTLEESSRDWLTNTLFLAGIRNERTVRFFSFLIKMPILLPAFFILLYLVTGSLTFGNFLKAIAIGVGLYIWARFFVRMLQQKRQRRILRNLPQLLDLVVVSVEAGLSFPSALERILKESDRKEPLIQEFNTMYHEYLSGIPLPQACERMDKRCGVADLSLLLSTIVQSEQIGSSLGSSLRTQSLELRDKLRQRVREQAFRIPVRILFPMILIFMAFIILNLGYIGFQMRTVVGGKIAVARTTHARR